MSAILVTRENGRDRILRCLDAFMTAWTHGNAIEAYDAEGQGDTEDGFALEIDGKFFPFTCGEAEAFIEVVEGVSLAMPAEAAHSGLSTLTRILKDMIEKTHARIEQ